jgi:hypothetical protein
MPAKKVEGNLSSQPLAIERQARLLIDAAVDGKLDQAPRRRS